MNKSKLVSIKEFIKILNNLSPDYQVRVYTKNKKGPAHPGVKTVRTSRLDRIEDSIAKLALTVNDLAKQMNAGFKQVNARIDRIEARLDYNGLKQLPNKR